MHWKWLKLLDPVGAAMPTLRAVPGDDGFLLAYEKAPGATSAHFIRVRYYRTEADLLANEAAAHADLPLHFSPYSNGTPAFLEIDWHGSLRRSIIRLSFHYEIAGRGPPGPDREAIGTLRGFRRWTARRESQVDSLLAQRRFRGNHGDRRQFSFEGRRWRVYEAQATPRDYATWHVLLYDLASKTIHPLKLSTAAGIFTASFGNPTAQVEHAPSGSGRVLVVTMFIFSNGPAAAEPGELVYYQPL